MTSCAQRATLMILTLTVKLTCRGGAGFKEGLPMTSTYGPYLLMIPCGVVTHHGLLTWVAYCFHDQCLFLMLVIMRAACLLPLKLRGFYSRRKNIAVSNDRRFCR